MGNNARRCTVLAVGSQAPDFALVNHHRQVVRLADFSGRKRVVVAFHALAFTPVCSAQMQDYERERHAIDALDAHVLAISLDANPSKKAWAESFGGFSFDLLSDFHPQGAVASSYGVLGGDGLPQRAIFLVDKAGTIRWTRLHTIDERPDVRELLDALTELRP
jgi:peroxiredoxin